MDVAHCNLEGNADAVEFCPHDRCRHVLTASTYILQEGDRPSRAGRISLFNVGAELGRLDLFQRIETAGIFNTKWNLVGDSVSLLAQAHADAYLRIHGLESCLDEAQGMECLWFSLKEITDEKISHSTCLFLDWNPSTTSITMGLPDGSIRESQLETNEMWNAHDFEVWTTSFDIHQPQLDGHSNLAFQNTKAHIMGVCCIAKNPNDTNSVVTGSYDEYLRVWDVRSIYKTLWRIKFYPFAAGLVLTVCMHNGFSIVNNNGDNIEVIETYNKHESFAYGADYTLVATCSFYDRLLWIWTPESDSQGFAI
ncbi:unnamed protein product [Malus baccata var. baccata]